MRLADVTQEFVALRESSRDDHAAVGIGMDDIFLVHGHGTDLQGAARPGAREAPTTIHRRGPARDDAEPGLGNLAGVADVAIREHARDANPRVIQCDEIALQRVLRWPSFAPDRDDISGA